MVFWGAAARVVVIRETCNVGKRRAIGAFIVAVIVFGAYWIPLDMGFRNLTGESQLFEAFQAAFV